MFGFIRLFPLFLMLPFSFAATAADWPAFRGPNGNGISTETGWSPDVASAPQLWRKQLGAGSSSFAVVDGRVYTAGNISDTEYIYCLDAATGEEIWKFSYLCALDPNMFEGGPGATPAVSDGRVYTLSRQGHIYCLDAATGEEIWSKRAQELGGRKPEWGFSGSPLVRGDRVIYPIDRIAAFHKATGALAWATANVGADYSSPVPIESGDVAALAVMTTYGLRMIDADSGEELDRHAFKTDYDVNAPTPLVFDGNRLFVTAGYNHQSGDLLTWDGKSLRKTGEAPIASRMATPVYWKGHIYGIHKRFLRSADAETGEERWTERGSGEGSLILADGKLIVMSDQGMLIVAEADPREFRGISRRQVLQGRSWVQPVLADGKIFCRSNAGEAVCLDVSGDAAEDSPL